MVGGEGVGVGAPRKPLVGEGYGLRVPFRLATFCAATEPCAVGGLYLVLDDYLRSGCQRLRHEQQGVAEGGGVAVGEGCVIGRPCGRSSVEIERALVLDLVEGDTLYCERHTVEFLLVEGDAAQRMLEYDLGGIDIRGVVVGTELARGALAVEHIGTTADGGGREVDLLAISVERHVFRIDGIEIDGCPVVGPVVGIFRVPAAAGVVVAHYVAVVITLCALVHHP